MVMPMWEKIWWSLILSLLVVDIDSYIVYCVMKDHPCVVCVCVCFFCVCVLIVIVFVSTCRPGIP